MPRFRSRDLILSADSFRPRLNFLTDLSRVEESLHEQCVDMRLLSFSCTVVPFHCLVFSNVPPSRFQAQDLEDPPQVQGFAIPKNPRVGNISM